MISPDGASYVSQDTATIEIGDARTGTVLRSIPPGNYDSVIAYTATGIYAYHTGEQVIPGLWKIDPSTGRVTQLQSSSTPVNWSLVDDNVAWGTYTTPDNVTAVMRLDLSTGVMTNIYQPAGQHDAAVVGLVGSGVMVVVESFGNAGLVSAIVVNDDGSTAPVAVPGTLLDKTFTHRLQDGSAIIFSGLGYGVAAYDPDHGLQLLIDTPQDMFLLGRCRPQ